MQPTDKHLLETRGIFVGPVKPCEFRLFPVRSGPILVVDSDDESFLSARPRHRARSARVVGDWRHEQSKRGFYRGSDRKWERLEQWKNGSIMRGKGEAMLLSSRVFKAGKLLSMTWLKSFLALEIQRTALSREQATGMRTRNQGTSALCSQPPSSDEQLQRTHTTCVDLCDNMTVNRKLQVEADSKRWLPTFYIFGEF